MKLTKKLSALAAAIVFAGSAATAQNSILYALGDSAATYGTGTNKAETYNVAIHIDEPSLVGATIKGVRVAFPYTQGLSAASAWLSQELPPVKSRRVTEPDVASKSFTLAEGYTEVTFDEPYTITAEGIYVGYAFTTSNSNDIAHPVVVTAEDREGGLFVHSTGTYRTAWRDFSDAGNGALAIQVLVESDAIKADAAGVKSVSTMDVKTGQVLEGSAAVVNHGFNGLSNFDYTVTLGDYTADYHVDLADPLPGVYSAQTKVTFPLPVLEEKGTYDLKVKVTQVNGLPNEDESSEGVGQLYVFKTLPKHRPVLEEYTGTWCGYCPRGFVGLEEMQRLYPEDFIGISYHNGDPMEVIPTSQYPWNAQVLGTFEGFPSAALDRLYVTDAFSGFSTYGTFGIDQAWLAVADVMAPAEVEVESEWADGGETLQATAHVTFPVDKTDCPYEVGFILVADGLTGTSSSWSQSNYYGGQQSQWPSSMDEFTTGGSYVSGLTYNFVYVARSGKAGISGSLVAPIVADEAQNCTYSFDLTSIKNTSGEPVIQDKNLLRVIAVLYDKSTGAILNANKAEAGASSVVTGVEQFKAVAPAANTYFDLQGRRVDNPSRGLYIINGKKVVLK